MTKRVLDGGGRPQRHGSYVHLMIFVIPVISNMFTITVVGDILDITNTVIVLLQAIATGLSRFCLFLISAITKLTNHHIVLYSRPVAEALITVFAVTHIVVVAPTIITAVGIVSLIRLLSRSKKIFVTIPVNILQARNTVGKPCC